MLRLSFLLTVLFLTPLIAVHGRSDYSYKKEILVIINTYFSHMGLFLRKPDFVACKTSLTSVQSDSAFYYSLTGKYKYKTTEEPLWCNG